ncbi:MAG TPA: HEAT repeat domain-containing protein [Acidobacteriota bacterium]|nr:HEAT repeat domain-containing protein [Acidobacteriota bacterium]
MTRPRIHHRVVRNRKKNRIPLSKLRASDAVKTVVDHPRRLEELLRMIEDKDRIVRGRAALALAKLSESHPARMVRVVERLKEMLGDDSAYVRWHLLYALGKLAEHYPMRARGFLSDLISRLDDDNRVCRILAVRALGQVALRRPRLIEENFQNLKKEMPPAISKILHKS